MSSNRKKTLFVALAGLLASATAIVGLATYPSTSEGDVEHYAGTSGPTAENISAQVSWDPFYIPSGELTRYAAAGWSNEAPGGINFSLDLPFETFSPFANTGGAVGVGFGAPENPVSFGQRQLFADITDMFAGPSDTAALESQLQLDPFGLVSSLSTRRALMSIDSGAHLPGPGLGGDTQYGPCEACAPLDPPASVPSGGNSPTTEDPPSSVPGNDLPGSDSPGNDSPAGEPPVTVTAPEPGSMGLLALGLVLLAVASRRRHGRV